MFRYLSGLIIGLFIGVAVLSSMATRHIEMLEKQNLFIIKKTYETACYKAIKTGNVDRVLLAEEKKMCNTARDEFMKVIYEIYSKGN